MRVHEIKGSCFVYIPKALVSLENLHKGDKVIWSLQEGDHRTLLIKKYEKVNQDVRRT